jgi:hypothetical protein
MPAVPIQSDSRGNASIQKSHHQKVYYLMELATYSFATRSCKQFASLHHVCRRKVGHDDEAAMLPSYFPNSMALQVPTLELFYENGHACPSFSYFMLLLSQCLLRANLSQELDRGDRTNR